MTKVVLRPAVFVNFRKAFISVNHQLILKKSPGYGIKIHPSEQTGPVVYGSTQSAPQQIKSGVPQGSILGPMLFSNKYKWLAQLFTPEDPTLMRTMLSFSNLTPMSKA